MIEDCIKIRKIIKESAELNIHNKERIVSICKSDENYLKSIIDCCKKIEVKIFVLETLFECYESTNTKVLIQRQRWFRNVSFFDFICANYSKEFIQHFLEKYANSEHQRRREGNDSISNPSELLIINESSIDCACCNTLLDSNNNNNNGIDEVIEILRILLLEKFTNKKLHEETLQENEQLEECNEEMERLEIALKRDKQIKSILEERIVVLLSTAVEEHNNNHHENNYINIKKVLQPQQQQQQSSSSSLLLSSSLLDLELESLEVSSIASMSNETKQATTTIPTLTTPTPTPKTSSFFSNSFNNHNEENYIITQISRIVERLKIIISEREKEIENYYNLEELESSEPESEPETNYLNENEKLEQLEREIYTHCMKCEWAYQQAWINVQPVYNILLEMSKKFYYQVDLIGSFATGLWSDFSDIDFVLVANDEDWPLNSNKVLNSIYEKLRWYDEEIYEIFVSSKEVPFPSITLKMTKKYGSLKVEISIFEKKNSAKRYVKFILDSIQMYPFIRPTFFLLRELLEIHSLHDRKKKGLKTYTIFLMIYFMTTILSTASLAEFFLKTLRYYGFAYEFSYELDSEGEMREKFNLTDPLNSFNNAGGKNTDVKRLKNMFRSTFETFHILEISHEECNQPGFYGEAYSCPIIKAFFELADILT